MLLQSKNGKSKVRKVVLIGCVIILLIPTLLCQLLPYRPPVNKQDYTSVVTAFFWALMENKESIAKSLTVSDKHSKIESWMTEHDAFSCSPIWMFSNSDPMETDVGGGVGTCEPEQDKCEWYMYQECYCFDHRIYRIQIDEITLEKFESGWLVVEWSEIHETRKGLIDCWK